LNFWIRHGVSRPVRGLLYLLYTKQHLRILVITRNVMKNAWKEQRSVYTRVISLNVCATEIKLDKL